MTLDNICENEKQGSISIVLLEMNSSDDVNKLRKSDWIKTKQIYFSIGSMIWDNICLNEKHGNHPK